jgi:hypothetical protein
VTITNRAGKTVWAATSTTATRKSFRSKPGQTYAVKVTGYDNSGHSASAAARYTVPLDDGQLTYSSNWSTASNSAAYGGSYHFSALAGADFQFAARAHNYTVWFVTSSSGGRANVYAGSTLVKVVDLYVDAFQPSA